LKACTDYYLLEEEMDDEILDVDEHDFVTGSLTVNDDSNMSPDGSQGDDLVQVKKKRGPGRRPLSETLGESGKNTKKRKTSPNDSQSSQLDADAPPAAKVRKQRTPKAGKKTAQEPTKKQLENISKNVKQLPLKQTSQKVAKSEPPKIYGKQNNLTN
jgi:hypothetical protein